MKTTLLSALLLATGLTAEAQRPDTLWYQCTDRFQPNKYVDIQGYDTIEFRRSLMTLMKGDGSGLKKNQGYFTATPGHFQFANPGRILCRPSSMKGDFMSEENQWCFARSRESEHFVVFWEEGAQFSPDKILATAEKCWPLYAGELGFVKPGQSTTDTYKIVMRVKNTTDWVAFGGGEDHRVATLDLNPAAAAGGYVVAHEIGHCFQSLTNYDIGANDQHGYAWGLGDNGAGGSGFWEDCANWMAYRVYPEEKFTTGSHLGTYFTVCHQNLMHEASRYNNCFYLDFLADRYGQDFIGRLWREAIRPEDPVEVIMRLKGLTQDDFSALMYDVFSHMPTWDTPTMLADPASRHRIGGQPMVLSENPDGTFQPDSAHCPQNYGYNATRLNLPAAGQSVAVHLRGIVGSEGYRAIKPERAGWRYGFAALRADGTTDYSPMHTVVGPTGEDSATYTPPLDAQRLWLVVVGAPTQWWHHMWDNDTSDDEQWPYRVQLTGTRPYGLFRTYTAADFPADYARHDTTVVIHAELAANSGSYSSVRVQYDMDAISQALGLTTEQLHAMRVGASENPRLVGVSQNGSLTTATTTSTSNASCVGHWFTATGNVCGYNADAVLFLETYPADYHTQVGQFPARLKKGQTYTARQAIVYRAPDNKTYRATMEVVTEVY